MPLRKAIVVDIDGTVALRGEREWWDYDRVDEDAPNEPVIDVVKLLYRSLLTTEGGVKVFVMSGRDDTCYHATLDWLAEHHVPCHALLMRDPTLVDDKGNKLADSDVKEALYREHIENDYEVVAVFDDRDSVVKRWRELGLLCLQVAEGDF